MKRKLLTLAMTFISSSVMANELTLYFIHSPLGLDWSTPQSLSTTTVANSIIPKKISGGYSIGHVYEEINCPRLGVHEFTGQTSTTDADNDRVLKEHWGLGAMIATEPGKLETTQEVTTALKRLYKNGRVAILKMAISENACERLVNYMQEYRELKLDQIYAGLHANPLKKQGSGCSAFGASMLEVTGLLLPEQYEAWTYHLGVPYRYIGGPRTGKEITILEMISAFNSKWTTKDDVSGGIWIDFYDPSRMNRWVKKMHHLIKKGKSPYSFATEAIVRNKAKGVYFDMRNFETPTGPIFHE
jgi:hypothetical protein